MSQTQPSQINYQERARRQAWRRQKNRLALVISMLAMAFGLFWLVWILFSTVSKGIDGMSLNLFTEMTPPPNTEGGGLANAIMGSGLLIFGLPCAVLRWVF